MERVLKGVVLLENGIRIVGIVLGAGLFYAFLRIGLMRLFNNAARGDHKRIASLRQVAKTGLNVVFSILLGVVVLDTLGVDIGAIIAVLGFAGLAISFGAQPLIKDIIAYISFVFADNFRVGEDVLMDGKQGDVVKFELRCVVLLRKEDDKEWLAYIPYSKIASIENYSREINDA